MNEIKLGDIAICQKGYLGLITDKRPHSSFKDKVVYTGIHLTPEFLGKKWQSVLPKVVSNIDELLRGVLGS